MNPADDPACAPLIRRVEETFRALTHARNRQSRVHRPEAAAAAYKIADKAYREAAAARDRGVERFRVQQQQTGKNASALAFP